MANIYYYLSTYYSTRTTRVLVANSSADQLGVPEDMREVCDSFFRSSVSSHGVHGTIVTSRLVGLLDT
jgi:hypothetical protein